MRSGKMMEAIRETLKHLLNELKSPRNALQICNFYKVGYWFRNENDAYNFRSLLLFNIRFNGVRIESHTTYRRTPGYLIYVTWHVSEQEDLIKNIEEYLQEDDMGPTNINRENTKFYAIVEDERGKETVYEITHSSLETRWECSFGESSITHTVEFDQDYMRKCDSVFTEWAKQKDELEKLRAENELLRKDMKDVSERLDKCEGENVGLSRRLVRCENQLRSACEFLNGYGDVDINIKEELLNQDYFSSIVNYTINGATKRREFGKKVAKNVRKRADEQGVWRKSESYRMTEEDNKILYDAVETAINPHYLSSAIYLDLTAGANLSGTITSIDTDAIYVQPRKSGSSKAMEMVKDMADKKQIKFDWTKSPWLYEWNPNGETTRHIKINVYDSIKDVMFANPATIVFWKDGTKTVVKAQGDEEYVPEVGLAMCICKKVMGNTRDYYRVFKHWMKKVKED